jgi:hypothetical protein
MSTVWVMRTEHWLDTGSDAGAQLNSTSLRLFPSEATAQAAFNQASKTDQWRIPVEPEAMEVECTAGREAVHLSLEEACALCHLVLPLTAPEGIFTERVEQAVQARMTVLWKRLSAASDKLRNQS